jgi:hypothetical protein
MTSNIVFLRDHVCIRDHGRTLPRDDLRAPIIRSNSRLNSRHGGHLQERIRPVLTAAWHTNPASGRVECHWTMDVAGTDAASTDATGAADESACCDDLASCRMAPPCPIAQAA